MCTSVVRPLRDVPCLLSNCDLLALHLLSALYIVMQDMRQIWTNCHLYNKKETDIDRIGRQAEQHFQDAWSRSGFAATDARSRRNNAGVAAPKFEPNEYGPPEKKLQRRTSGSKNGRNSSRKVLRCSAL